MLALIFKLYYLQNEMNSGKYICAIKHDKSE